jgi:hypothetical protein
MNKKNIILIDVDALIPSRTGFGGNIKSISPNLNEIAKQSLYVENVFTMGNPTEFALPGLFASSYLLDDGGYRYGISKKEITFAEVLKENGYSTSAFMTAFRPKLDGYDRGVDEYFNLIDIQVAEKNLMNTANWYRAKYKSKDSGINKDECITELVQYYDEYLDDILLYCENWKKYIKSKVIPQSSIFNNVDYDWVRAETIQDKLIFNNDRQNYIKKYLEGGELGLTKITKKVNEQRKKKVYTTTADIKVKIILIFNLIFAWRRSSSFSSAKSVLVFMLDRIRHGRKNHLMRYPSGEYVLETFKSWMKNRKDKNHFFSYIKLMDVHEQNFYSHDICNDKKEEINNDENIILKQAIQDIKGCKEYKGNILYDCAIRYEDNVIKKLFSFLEEMNVLDDTIVVITADHGCQIPNMPIRDNRKHSVSSFYDELYRIPLMFFNKGIAIETYKELVSSVDINTTILDLVNIKSPMSFKGKSLIDRSTKRDYILAENQGRGPCHLKYKPIRVCVRTNFLKLVYETSPLYPEKGFIDELYDLVDDPNEYNNLVNNKLYMMKTLPLIDIANNRVSEILG